jgi:hypothetical protein
MLLALSSLVVTDREQVIAACHRLGSLVEDGDVRAIDRMLADDFEAQGFDRFTFVERLERGLTQYRVSDVSLRKFEVIFPREDVGVIEFHATARVRSANLIREWVASSWRLTFREVGDRWLVTRIMSAPTSPFTLSVTVNVSWGASWLRNELAWLSP